MEPTPLVPVCDDVWRWSVWNEPRQLWFNGHLLAVGDTFVLIDPVECSEAVIAAIGAIGSPSLCVVTNRDHERAAAAARARWGAHLLVPDGDALAMTLDSDERFVDGAMIASELRVVGVAGAKTAGESALHWAARRVLVLGDAAIGRPRGALSLPPADKLPDLALARAGVAKLAALDVDVVLVGDGDDLLAGGSDALAALGDGPPRGPAAGVPGC